VTGSNLENAPPAAISHVDTHPIYDEDTILRANAKREERKLHQLDDNAKITGKIEFKSPIFFFF
jgi:hypothetical protein